MTYDTFFIEKNHIIKMCNWLRSLLNIEWHGKIISIWACIWSYLIYNIQYLHQILGACHELVIYHFWQFLSKEEIECLSLNLHLSKCWILMQMMGLIPWVLMVSALQDPSTAPRDKELRSPFLLATFFRFISYWSQVGKTLSFQ